MKRNLFCFGCALVLFSLSAVTAGAQTTANQADGPSRSGAKSVSADGRYIAFHSSATNLVPDDTNGLADVFVRDRTTGITERISVDSAGNEALGGDSEWPKISADGRYVVFTSSATNLVPDDTNGLADVFVHDRDTGLTERISVDSDGNQVWDSGSHSGDISADGRYVTFVSQSAKLVVPNDTNALRDVFLRDRVSGATEKISLTYYGAQTRGHSDQSTISADGRYVAFKSGARYLVPDDTNGAPDIFVLDRDTGLTERVSVDTSGNEGSCLVYGCTWCCAGSLAPVISADGRHVAFQSAFPDLVVGDENDRFDVFVHDRDTGVTERVSVDSSGRGGQTGYQIDGGSFEPSISADGLYVTFHSDAWNFVPYDYNRDFDIFVRDRVTGVTERVSVDSDGRQASGDSSSSALTSDGRYVAFSSHAYNLVPNDTNQVRDVFMHDRDTGVTERVTVGYNQPPEIVVDLDPVIVDEGSLATNGGPYWDPDDDVVEFSASDGTVSTINGTWIWSFQSSDNITSQVVITADDGTETASVDFQLIVNNVAPVVGEITAPIDPVPVGTSITASAVFSDPGMADTHTATWNWGVGANEVGTVTEINGSGSVTDTHIYAAPGVYTITLTVTDDDGDSGESTYRYVVVYDPDGAYVTGGGMIDSPVGAYRPDPSLVGRARFGFTSRYLPGANTPTGRTQFQFHAAGLDFTSDTYQWLVVAGARAQFKGAGSIKGMSGGYGFMLTAIDGEVSGGGGVDKFRIKIWDSTTEDVVYDNQMGAEDDADVTTAITKGSIAIYSTNNGGS
jgi:archaellum component FlaF (FlaF/FlaG flagellin family)